MTAKHTTEDIVADLREIADRLGASGSLKRRERHQETGQGVARRRDDTGQCPRP